MNRHDTLTFDGVTQPILEWALDYGIPSSLIMRRLDRGMPVRKAITMPMKVQPGEILQEEKPRGKTITADGMTMTIPQWAKHLGVSDALIYGRLKCGWSDEDAVTKPVVNRLGAVSNLDPFKGTGAGSTAQNIPNITFTGAGRMTALAALKAHLDIDGTADDDLLSSKIEAAEDYITTYIDDAEIATTFATARPTIREAILQLAGHWYLQREAVAERSLQEIPFGVSSLIYPYRRWEF